MKAVLKTLSALIGLGVLAFAVLVGAVAWSFQELLAGLGSGPRTVRVADLEGPGPAGGTHVLLTDFTFGPPVVETSGQQWKAVWLPVYAKGEAGRAEDFKVVLRTDRVKNEAELDRLRTQPSVEGFLADSSVVLKVHPSEAFLAAHPGRSGANTVFVTARRPQDLRNNAIGGWVIAGLCLPLGLVCLRVGLRRPATAEPPEALTASLASATLAGESPTAGVAPRNDWAARLGAGGRLVHFQAQKTAFLVNNRTVYRIYLDGDALLFLKLGSGYANPAQLAATGGAVGGLIGGLIAARKQKQIDERARALDGADAARLRRLADELDDSFRATAEELLEVSLEPRSLWVQLTNGTRHVALLRVRHARLGKMTLELVTREDLVTAFGELPRMLGDRVRVRVDWHSLG